MPTVLIATISQYLPNQQTIPNLGLGNRNLYQIMHQTRMMHCQSASRGCKNSNVYQRDSCLELDNNNIYHISKYKSDLSNYSNQYKTLIVNITRNYFDHIDFSEHLQAQSKFNDNNEQESTSSLEDMLSNSVVFEKNNVDDTLQLMSTKKYQYIYALKDTYYNFGYKYVQSRNECLTDNRWDTSSIKFIVNAFINNILNTQWFEKLLQSIETLKIQNQGMEIVSLFPLDKLFSQNSNLQHIEIYDYANDEYRRKRYMYDFTKFNSNVPKLVEPKSHKINIKPFAFTYDNYPNVAKIIDDWNSNNIDGDDGSPFIPNFHQSFNKLRLVNGLYFDTKAIIDYCDCPWSRGAGDVIEYMVRLFHCNLDTLELSENIQVHHHMYNDQFLTDLSRAVVARNLEQLHNAISKHKNYTKPNIKTLILHKANATFCQLIKDPLNVSIHVILNWFNTVETIHLQFDKYCFNNLNNDDNKDNNNTANSNGTSSNSTKHAAGIKILLDTIDILLLQTNFEHLQNVYISFTLFSGHRMNVNGTHTDDKIRNINILTAMVDHLNTNMQVMINNHTLKNVQISAQLIHWKQENCADNSVILQWNQSDQLSPEKLRYFENTFKDLYSR